MQKKVLKRFADAVCAFAMAIGVTSVAPTPVLAVQEIITHTVTINYCYETDLDNPFYVQRATGEEGAEYSLDSPATAPLGVLKDQSQATITGTIGDSDETIVVLYSYTAPAYAWNVYFLDDDGNELMSPVTRMKRQQLCLMKTQLS